MRNWVRSLGLFIIIMAGACRAHAQKETLTSRFYFPGLIGVNFIDENASIRYSKAFSISSGMEYRPDSAHVFYRFNYDGTTIKYVSAVTYLPTSVTKGKQHTTNLLIGAGYRKKFNGLGAYVLVQGGLASQSFDHVNGVMPAYTITQQSINSFGLKFTGGFEYYVASHFALIAEPSIYHNTARYRDSPINNTQVTFSLGFTTTLF